MRRPGQALSAALFPRIQSESMTRGGATPGHQTGSRRRRRGPPMAAPIAGPARVACGRGDVRYFRASELLGEGAFASAGDSGRRRR